MYEDKITTENKTKSKTWKKKLPGLEEEPEVNIHLKLLRAMLKKYHFGKL